MVSLIAYLQSVRLIFYVFVFSGETTKISGDMTQVPDEMTSGRLDRLPTFR